MSLKMSSITKFFTILALVVAIVALGKPSRARADEYGCERHVGAVGAIIGGLIGHQIGHGAGNVFATIAGAMIGASVDRNIYCEMSRRDHEAYEEAMHDGLYGDYRARPYEWEGEDYSGRFIVISDGYMGPRYCREYRSEVFDGYGRLVSVREGLMCQRGYNEWYPEERHSGWHRREY
jgi:surface antigen